MPSLWAQLFEVVVVMEMVVAMVAAMEKFPLVARPSPWPHSGFGIRNHSLSSACPSEGVTHQPLPSSPFPPSEVSSHPRQSHPPPLCTPSWGSYYHGDGRTNCNPHPAEVQAAEPAPHPHPGQEWGRLNSRFEWQKKERIKDLGNRFIKMIHSKEHKGMKKSEQCL